MEYHLDFETYSEAPLKQVGSARYAADPTSLILLCAIGKKGEGVRLWSAPSRAGVGYDNQPALAWLKEAAGPDSTIWAHNDQFERDITSYLWERTFGFAPPPEEHWRCTSVLCRMAGIPGSLEKAAEFLSVMQLKDKKGAALIRKFCVPNDNTPAQVMLDLNGAAAVGPENGSTEAWQEFSDYCIQDVKVEMAIHQQLKALAPTGWQKEAVGMNARLNRRGVPVNHVALQTAQQIVRQGEEQATARFVELTGVAPSCVKKVLVWMKGHGYDRDDMTSASVQEAISNDKHKLSAVAYKALKIKQLVGYAALKKLPAMRSRLCPDGTIKGMFTFWGAARTGRYTSTGVQLQNLKRPTQQSEEVYRSVVNGATYEQLDLLYGNPLKRISETIRHYLGYSDGTQMLCCDFSQIEARVLPYLAGHTTLLNTFHEGNDLYIHTIAEVMGLPANEVTKDLRQLGKVVVLACGFAGGIGAMTRACDMYGVQLADNEKRSLIKRWRENNAPIVGFWGEMATAAISAIRQPNTWHSANKFIRFRVHRELGFEVLAMELPSGRLLHYPKPMIEIQYRKKQLRANLDPTTLDDDDDGMEWVVIPVWRALKPDGMVIAGVWASEVVTYFGQLSQSISWGRIRTHGGVLAQNATQAVAGDFLMLGTINAEKEGYLPMLTVHDELLTQYHPEKGNSVWGLGKAMCKIPEWAPDFPLQAIGAKVDFYTK